MLPFGKIDPRKMQSMLKQMGINSRDIEAEEVIIKTTSEEIVIKNPQVSEIDMQGNKSFQIIGEITKRERVEETEAELDIKEDDIKLVMERSKVGKHEAQESLEKTKGDIVKAIMLLKKR